MDGTHKREGSRVLIRGMSFSDATVVARLHHDRIGFGFLSSLGLGFLSTLYTGILTSGFGSCWVAELEGEVVGFVTATKDVSRLYKVVLKENRWRLILALLPSLASPRVWQYALETLRYPSRQKHVQLPPAEILSIVVGDRCAGGGIGRRLIDRALEHLWSQGVTDTKVAVAANLPANGFYRATGWELAGAMQNHGHLMNLYVMHRPATYAP